jgi:aminoglycoside phosphotransferase (APT) family kinase protein
MPAVYDARDALLRQRPSGATRRWVGSVLGGEVVATRRLPGGISSATRAVTVRRPDGTTVRAVLRTFVDEEWLAAEPELAAREAALLQVLEGESVPAPRVLGVDPDGAASGSVSLLMSLEPGRPVNDPVDRRPWIAGLIDALARIHAVAPPSLGLRDQPGRLDLHTQEPRPHRHGVQVDEALWAHVRRRWPGVVRRPPTLIHDDFHPGNVLWSRGRLMSVVDWTGAGVGDPASDACYLRLDVSLVSGLDAGDEVLAAYEAAVGAPVADRPFWDLVAAARAKGAAHLWWGSYQETGLPVTLPEVEQRLDRFIARAIADLG